MQTECILASTHTVGLSRFTQQNSTGCLGVVWSHRFVAQRVARKSLGSLLFNPLQKEMYFSHDCRVIHSWISCLLNWGWCKQWLRNKKKIINGHYVVQWKESVGMKRSNPWAFQIHKSTAGSSLLSVWLSVSSYTFSHFDQVTWQKYFHMCGAIWLGCSNWCLV